MTTLTVRNPEELLTTDQAGKVLGVGAADVRYLIREGRLPATTFGRRHYLLRRGTVEAYRGGWRPEQGAEKNSEQS